MSHLSDILVPDSADLLDVGGALRDLLEVVAGDNELVLLGLGGLDVDALLHDNLPHDLLTQEVSVRSTIVSASCPFWSLFQAASCSICPVPDLDLPQTGLLVLVEVDVDGEMGVDVTHLVLEALGDTDDHVVDEGADGAEGGDVLPVAVVHLFFSPQ